ncbi:MAG TPA: response regulator [Gaiellaceae bacterium]|nr:response regulator [Gaiellaceae bacterium]
MIELLLCDGSDEARAALRAVLVDHDDIAVVGEAADGEDAVALALALAPDVVLMGLRMPFVDGIDATRRIKQLLPATRIVALAGVDDAESVIAMMEAGAAASCVKGAPLWELERALTGVNAPLVRLAHGLARATNPAGIGTIVSRELLVLTGAGVAAAYVSSPDVVLSLAGLAGTARTAALAAAPSLALRAYSTLGCAHADHADLRELELLGVSCSDALAVPLVSDGEALGALLLAMPDHDDLVADEDFVSDIAALAASAFAAERRLAVEQTRGGPSRAISAGVATYPADAVIADGLAIAADNALYAARWRGKSRAGTIRSRGGPRAGARESATPLPPAGSRGARVLFVDDDPAFLTLLRTTFELIDIEIDEAGTAAKASAAIAARPPDVVVLDVGLPDLDGISFCRRLKQEPATSSIGVVLLTGAADVAEAAAREAGADALLGKPFSPLELLAVVERLAGGETASFERGTPAVSGEQLLLYAGDVRRLLQLERGRRELLQRSYRQTAAALAGALESKDVSTATHSQRVQRYAIELARTIDASLLHDPSIEYGFLLHDVGKIGIPDHVLQKPGPLTDSEQRLMRTHTVLGEQLLRDVELLHGDGLKVVRWHHERWDGLGYPDGLARSDVPLAARVFAVADALDAITSERPYRPARRWDEAAAEIVNERGRQFDPDVVDAFCERERSLSEIRGKLAAA